MNQTTQDRNKALVFVAFDTLFNKRDLHPKVLKLVG
jgi:hypothetical protein